MKTFKAQGSTGLADALAAALKRTVQVTPTRRWSGKQVQTQNLPKLHIDAETFTQRTALKGLSEDGAPLIKQACVECHSTTLYSLAPDWPNVGECAHCGHPNDLHPENVVTDKYRKDTPPVPAEVYEQRRKREEQAKAIAKLSAIIKREDPRLLAEALQEFGSIEGLNAQRQAAFIAKLMGIMKTYGL